MILYLYPCEDSEPGRGRGAPRRAFAVYAYMASVSICVTEVALEV